MNFANNKILTLTLTLELFKLADSFATVLQDSVKKPREKKAYFDEVGGSVLPEAHFI